MNLLSHKLIRCLLIAIVVSRFSHASHAQQLTADSQPQPGVPQGRIEGPLPLKSEIFPGTERNYWVYIPAQYTTDKPACVLVVQDGLNRAQEWRLPTVMDNLIHQGKMPVTIGIFIEPGVVPATDAQGQPRYNRSFEYDSLGDRYARFLLEEVLPTVGKTYALSQDGNDRAIAGASSGAICAWTVAWERPDAFRRVFSTIGTYTALRGGDVYPTWVRKFEPKPIRVFLQDGSHDLNIYGGDWWMANQSMLSALRFANYDVQHAWGDGGHDGKQGAEVTPDAMRFLWRDYPKPIQPGRNADGRPLEIILPDEDWQLVSQGHRFTEGPAVNAQGEVFFTDVPAGKVYKVDLQGNVRVFVENSPGVNGLMFRSDGYLYACQSGNKQIVRYDSQGREEVILTDASGNDLVTFARGGYFTDPDSHRVWFVNTEGQRQVVDEGIAFPNGVVMSPDQHWLYVSDTRGRFVYSYQIQADGTLRHKQVVGHLHLPDETGESGADGMTVDRQGRLYVTTRLGLQVLDPLGRVHVILRKPQNAWLSNVVFGGPQFDTLYVTCADKVYRRKVAAEGAVSWQSPITPPKPRL